MYEKLTIFRVWGYRVVSSRDRGHPTHKRTLLTAPHQIAATIPAPAKTVAMWIAAVRCPTLCMHGTVDEVLDMSHTALVHANTPVQYRRDPFRRG